VVIGPGRDARDRDVILEKRSLGRRAHGDLAGDGLRGSECLGQDRRHRDCINTSTSTSTSSTSTSSTAFAGVRRRASLCRQDARPRFVFRSGGSAVGRDYHGRPTRRADGRLVRQLSRCDAGDGR
jgi:hypothetical protein